MVLMWLARVRVMEERSEVTATTGCAIGLSAFASFVGLCCVGPWSVAVLGISGAVALARWQPYRLYIVAVAAALLAWAFWRVYRQQSASRWLKATLWIATALVVLAFFAEELQWILIDPSTGGIRQ